LTSTGFPNCEISEGELNDLLKELDVTKNKAKILVSMLKEWNLQNPKGK